MSNSIPTPYENFTAQEKKEYVDVVIDAVKSPLSDGTESSYSSGISEIFPGTAEEEREKLLKNRTKKELALLEKQREKQDFLSEGDQWTLLALACETDQLDVLLDKLRKMDNMNVYDEKGQSFFHHLCTISLYYKDDASINDKVEAVINFLVEEECNIDVQDDLGKTPLHVAADKRNERSFRFLVYAGANIYIKDFIKRRNTPAHTVISKKLTNLTKFLVAKTDLMKEGEVEFDHKLFKLMCDNTPDAVVHFLDLLCDKTLNEHDDEVFQYHRVKVLYGNQKDIRKTPIHTIMESKNNTKLIKHNCVQFVLKKKWEMFAGIMYVKEFFVFFLFLTAVIWSTMNTLDDKDKWYRFEHNDNYFTAVLKGLNWLLLLYHIIFIECLEVKNEENWCNYFNSVWNWINMISYALLAMVIPFEFYDSLTDARLSAVSVAVILLLFNLLQFLQINQTLGTFVSMFGKMFEDVKKFLMFFMIFQLGFTISFHILLHNVPGRVHQSFFKDFVYVYLYSQGAFDVNEGFERHSQMKRFLIVFLLVLYTIIITLMLMNLLIALMASTYERVQENAEGELKVIKAEAFLRLERMLTVEKRQALYDSLDNDMTDAIGDDEYELEEKNESLSAEMLETRTQQMQDHFAKCVTELKEQNETNEKKLNEKIDDLSKSILQLKSMLEK